MPCLKAADVPTRPTYQCDKLPSNVSEGEKVIALVIDWPVGKKYEAHLEAIVIGCQ
jgi:hypothetical protein